MSDDQEIDPHTYVIARAQMRYVPIAELLALVVQHTDVVEGFANGHIGAGQVVTRAENGGYEVFDGAMSKVINDAQATAAITHVKRPPGFDWRSAQNKLPRAGKRRRTS